MSEHFTDKRDENRTSETSILALEQHFAYRDKILSQFENKKSPDVILALRRHEEKFRAEAIGLLLETRTEKPVKQSEEKQQAVHPKQADKNEKDADDSKEDSDLSSNEKKLSIFERIHRFLLFEIHYSVPALFNLAVYCLAHCGTYCLVNTIIVECADSADNVDSFYLFVLFLGLFLARITGGVWMWISEETRHELKDRGKEFGPYMAWRWWSHTHYDLREACKTLSFFISFVAVFFFYQYRFLKPWDSRNTALQGLPSLQQGVATYFCDLLDSEIPEHDEMEHRWPEETEVDDNSCDLGTNLTTQDDMYLRSQLSVESYYFLLGDSGALLVSTMTSILYAFLVSLFSIVLLKKRGLNFWVME